VTVTEEVYRKNLGIILAELNIGNIEKAKKMIKEEIWMSEND